MAFALELFLLFAIFSSSFLNSQAKITYADHCSSIVPQPSFSTMSRAKNISIHLSNGYFTGGENIFSSSSSSKNITPGKVYFYANEIYSTEDPNIYHLSANLHSQGESRPSYQRASDPKDLRRQVRYSGWSSIITAYFRLSGFWSKSTGKLCMVGTGSSRLRGKYNENLYARYTMNYPKDTDIYNTIVRGMLISLDIPESLNYFDTISIVGYHKSKDYSYTKITTVEAMCASLKVPTKSIGFEKNEMSNYIQYFFTTFHLEYGKHCSSDKNCISPLFTSSEKKFMTLGSIESSEDGKVTMLISFTNSSYYGYGNSMVPGKSLVGEGYWDSDKKILCILACPILEDLSVGECTIGLSFRFPSVFTVKDRSNVLGRIWSTKGKKEPGYFNTISLRSLGDNKGFISSVKYEYMKLDALKKNCEEKNHSYAWIGRYPNGNSVADLNFDLTLKTKDNQSMVGYAVPLSFDDNFFGDSFFRITTDVSFSETKNYFNHSLYNVSYLVKYSSTSEKESTVDISAEGIYNSATGKFCMVGCKSPSYTSNDDSQDCEIQINIQLSPYFLYTNNTGIRHLVNGSIVSTRKKIDPHYFEPLELLSYKPVCLINSIEIQKEGWI